jgi:hypothetical protein
MQAVGLFENAISCLQENYTDFRFFTERDMVWTVQTHIIKLIEKQNLAYRIFHNFPVLPGKTTDLAILRQDNSIEVAAEFKYEPSHSRKFADIWPTKFPVVFWEDGVGKDMERVREFVSKGRAEVAYLIFIDEGGYFRWREPFKGSEWIDWQNGVSVLWARVEKPK